MKRKGIIIKGISRYLSGVLVVNSIVILSCALRFELKATLYQIYANPSLYSFTYLTILLTPVFVGLFYHRSGNFMVSMTSLARALSLNFTAIIIIIYLVLPKSQFPVFKYRSLILITWFVGMCVLSIVNISGSGTQTGFYASKRSSNSILNAFMPRTNDIKALLIGIVGSIIAFFLIYHLFGYK